MTYTQEQIGRANQVNLEQFLHSQGETLIKSGHEYRWKSHDSLTVKANKWFRHSQSKGGYPIDFVMEFYGKTFPEAVQMLLNELPAGESSRFSFFEEFRLPPRYNGTSVITEYLTANRKIPLELLNIFLSEGLIYESDRFHNVVFVGKDGNGVPRYAHC